MKRADIINLFPDATDEQISALMNINGNDVNKAKGNLEETAKALETAQAELKTLQESGNAEKLQKALERATAAEKELSDMKAEKELSIIRQKVASETGVPVGLLTMTTEDDCKAQAAAIVEFAKPSAYPSVIDGGEAHVTPQKTTAESFTEWFNQIS